MSELLELSEHLRVYHEMPTLLIAEVKGEYALLHAVHEMDHEAARGNRRPLPIPVPHEHSLFGT